MRFLVTGGAGFLGTALSNRLVRDGHQVRALDDLSAGDPARLDGQPCIRDLRLTVRRVLEAMATYPDREELRREYPELEDEDLRQALEMEGLI